MAMTTCDECKAEISSTAETCPRCGARQASAARGRVILLGIVLLAIVVAMGKCSNSGQPAESSPPSVQSSAKAEVAPPEEKELTGNCTDKQRSVLQAFLKSEGMTCDIVNYCGAMSAQNIRVTCNGDNFAYRIRDRGAGYYVEFD